jgi:hypothetical protein
VPAEYRDQVRCEFAVDGPGYEDEFTSTLHIYYDRPETAEGSRGAGIDQTAQSRGRSSKTPDSARGAQIRKVGFRPTACTLLTCVPTLQSAPTGRFFVAP